MRYVNAVVLSADDSTDQNGDLIDANQLISASFHAYFGDASANGTIKIQASNDISNAGNMAIPSGFAPVNWVDVPNASAAVASGASVLVTIAQMSYRWIRVVYTRTSGGSSTVTVNMMALSV